VSRETKVLIGVGAIVGLGVVLAVGVNLTAGLIVMVIGIAAAIAALRFTRPDTTDPFADARTEADETQVGNITPNQPLAPWSPDGGLNAWTPPVSLTGLPDAAPTAPMAATPPPAPAPAPTEPVAETHSWNDAWSNDDDWDSAPTWEPTAATSTETNPLDELQGFDTMDPIAEVERIEARGHDDTLSDFAPPVSDNSFSGFSFGEATRAATDEHLDFQARQVNEDVAGADDIMAASQATELNLAAGEQTELQKLLAKVQIRLSAYE
jgi:hypothetical protein